MKRASTLVLALVTLLGFSPRAHAAALRQLANLASGQMSFDGLDLTSDEKPSKGKKGKKTKAKKGKKGKAGKEEEEETTPSAGPDLAARPRRAHRRRVQRRRRPRLPSPPRPRPRRSRRDRSGAQEDRAQQARADDVVRGHRRDRQERRAAEARRRGGPVQGPEVRRLRARARGDYPRIPKNAELVPEARYLLAKTLYRMGLYHSALAQFNLVLATGPQSKFFKTSLEWLFYIAHKTVNEDIVLDTVAKYSNYEFPPKFQSEFHYLLAKYHFERGKALLEAGRQQEGQSELDQSNRLVLAFNKNDPFYGKAKYIEGLIQFDLGKEPVALEAFKEVVRANNPRVKPTPTCTCASSPSCSWRARTTATGRTATPSTTTTRCSAGSDQWLEALFEACLGALPHRQRTSRRWAT